MKKKHLIIAIVSVIIAIIASIGFKTRELDNIIDVHADNFENIYYLSHSKTGVYLNKTSDDGESILSKRLSENSGNKSRVYKEIVTDSNSNIYILVSEIEEDGELSNKIEKYDSNGKYAYDILERDYVKGEISGEFSIQMIDDVLVALENKNNKEINLTLNDLKEDESIIKNYIFMNKEHITDMIYDGEGRVYYIDELNNLYMIDESHSRKKIELGDSQETIIPYNLSVDSEGNIYFTDVHNFRFMQYDRTTEEVREVFSKNETLFKTYSFADIRKAEYLNNKVVGISPGYLDKEYIIVENKCLIDSYVYSTKEIAIIGIISFIVAFLLSELIVYVFIKIKSIRKILIKQILMFLPIIFIMVGFLLYQFNNIMKTSLQNQEFRNIYSMAEMIVMNIDGEEFEGTDFLEDTNSEFERNINKIINMSFDELEKQGDFKNSHVDYNMYCDVYYIKDGQLYIAFGTDVVDGMLLEYILPKKKIYDFINNDSTSVQIGVQKDMYGTWMGCAMQIYDDDGEPVGYIDMGIDQEKIIYEINKITLTTFVLLTLSMLIILLLIYLATKKSLKPLDKLKEGVDYITQGEVAASIYIDSNDEFEDIGFAFNKMSSRLNNYFKSIMNLSNAYEKFVPKEFFKLLNRESVLDVGLEDQVVKEMSVLSISTKNFHQISKKMSTKENFHYINHLFKVSSNIINENNGILKEYKGSSLNALYDNNTEKALDAALKIMEILRAENNSEDAFELNVTIQKSELMLGIIGNERRMEAVAISNEVNNIYFLEKFEEEFDINILVTEAAYKEIADKKKYQFRYIGSVKDGENNLSLNLYECLDGYLIEEKNRKLLTKDIFEKGIGHYLRNEYGQARRCFIDVLRMDKMDKLARMYLFKCEDE